MAKVNRYGRRLPTKVMDVSDSSAFSDVRWRGEELFVTFTDGYQASYPVDFATFQEMNASGSRGAFFNEYIRE
jgi:KTSC domain